MIYAAAPPEAQLSQGDIFDVCSLIYWDDNPDAVGDTEPEGLTSPERVVVLTQSCDLANNKTRLVQVAVVHEVDWIVSEGILKPATISDQVRTHRVFGWYFLPSGRGQPESIVNLRDLHTVPRWLLERQVADGHRSCTISPPYREHLAQHFETTYSRIALPLPYDTEETIE